VERNPTVVVLDLEVRRELEQRRDGALVAEPGGHVQRRLSVYVLPVDERLVVAHAAAELANDRRSRLDVGTVVRYSVVQRRPAFLIGHVQLGSSNQQYVYHPN